MLVALCLLNKCIYINHKSTMFKTGLFLCPRSPQVLLNHKKGKKI